MSDGLTFDPPTPAADGQGWGVSYFGSSHLESGEPAGQELRARVAAEWVMTYPSVIFAGWAPFSRYEVWWTSWAWLEPGWCRPRLTATVSDLAGVAASAEFQLIQFTRGTGNWTASLLASLQPTAATAQVAAASTDVEIPEATWYLLAVAYRYDGVMVRHSSLTVRLEWWYPQFVSERVLDTQGYRTLEGYFLHPVWHYPGNWPTEAADVQPLSL